MKRKLTFNKALLWVVAGCSITIASCTKRFESINTDPYGLSEEDLAGDFKQFAQVQLNIHQYAPDWQYQRGKNLGSDIWSGFMMTPNAFAGNVNNTNYAMIDEWNNTGWVTAYAAVMAPLKAIANRAAKDNLPQFEAWALLLKVVGMHRITDTYGPIVYNNFSKINSDGSVTYESQKDVYYAFFKDLDDAQTKLAPFVDKQLANPEGFKNDYGVNDLAYNGSFDNWMRLLNSTRLRLANRIAKIDPAKAKTEGEKALGNKYGLLETNAQDFIINSKTITNPIEIIAIGWGNIRMNASMESFLNGYADPRMKKYFLPATDPDFAGQYRGIRSGITITGNEYTKFSSIAPLGTKMPLMTAAETWFLRAEAKLRGWTDAGVSTVKEAYENGIKLSFSQWGVAASELTAYLNSNATPRPYVDPKNPANDVNAGNPILSTITPKWDDAAPEAVKLERIITQKWIATFPESGEAWAEQRRTGFPKIFPVVINNSGGVIPNGQFIKRVPFVISEREANQAGYQSALKVLDGDDNAGTRVWWNK
ncbi:SusD/RagB family nutrient-binding outer membrane lipoprotein [Pseudoflavitalea sp. G-6-1-2]|uniref:SusD/RagB family nutrient-binding outer membrane lipoprotein n=1 Tax=Pseudoflavitalea sp. G-6-1-2 TaxID=2728841 RepID=UPI00146DDE5D|nr:SusD/RagB family nutrient-binding outer membrane lipoprotein [Pseudoflavitalea sp. G-6-1-2]NML22175.1 SusD/RagB family nutrient-binding outer membrane lipoprotein [Pseudoflavitalea sp. G-6-1-2]